MDACTAARDGRYTVHSVDPTLPPLNPPMCSQAPLQVPSTWRPLIEDPSTLQLMLDFYAVTKPPLSSIALECLVSTLYHLTTIRGAQTMEDLNRCAAPDHGGWRSGCLMPPFCGFGEPCHTYEMGIDEPEVAAASDSSTCLR